MPKIFKTPKDSTDPVEVVGVGVAGSEGRGGIPIEDASQRMSELQGGGGIPLTGKALEEAAEAFAEARGLEVVNVKQKEVDGLAQEWGNPPDPIDAGEAAIAEYDRVFGSPDQGVDETSEPAAGGETEAAVGGSSTEG